MEIRKIAVLGSGVMGSGIAALAANAGLKVALLDIVPKGAENRSALAQKGIERQLKSGGFTHADNASRITPGNFEDDLELLKGADWIIEAVLEKLEVKQEVYKKIDPARKKGSVVSSNTSTIPIHDLASGMSEQFQKDFMIAHFFNPPRHMRLLEVVKSRHTRKDAYDGIRKFADQALGKEVVECKDTPGFIANRIGIYWMAAGLTEALKLGVKVEQADAAMGRPAGMPKTAMFGLYDLIGIDLIPLIAEELLSGLSPDDDFRKIYEEPPLIKRMISDGYTGRKGKGGFYRMEKQGEKKTMQVMDFKTGEYRSEQKSDLPSAGAKSVKELVSAEDVGGRYARAVLSRTLGYAASLIPEISDTVVAVDQAMKNGYSWKYGPFEMIDAIGAEELAKILGQENITVPPILKTAAGKRFYKDDSYLTLQGSYAAMPHEDGHLWLADISRGRKPVLENESARLWDADDGIAVLELTTKMCSVDEGVLSLIEKAVPEVEQNFSGLVIGNDGEQFSVGANLNLFLESARAEDWDAIRALLERGQQAMLSLKYAPFPVVASLAGLALGGGCEIVLHSAAVQAHMEAHPGLVEVKVGLIPAWGGCTELLLRHQDPLPVFDMIVSAKTAGSAEEAREMKILRPCCGITMNRARLLADAKTRCLKLAKNYQAPAAATLKAGGAAAKNAMLERLEKRQAEGNASPHDVVIGRVLAHVLSGGETEGGITEEKLMEWEREGFLELVRTTASRERIEHMLKTGKPLRN